MTQPEQEAREMLDWRKPYRSIDASGTPDSAGAIGWEWINALGLEARQAAGEDGGRVCIECPTLGGDAFAMALYDGQTLIALASVFRDPMNFSVLVRWRKEASFAARSTAGIDREVARMREIANDWRRPALAQVEGPNDLKIYGGTIADDIDRWANMLEAPAKTGERGAVIEECARVAEGWPADTADGEYQTDGNSHFWDAGNVYDQARVDAAFRVRALSQPLPDAPIVGGELKL